MGGYNVSVLLTIGSFSLPHSGKTFREDEDLNSKNKTLLQELKRIVLNSNPATGTEELSKKLRVSRVQLHRIIALEKGMSTTGYINSLKIKKAKKLLRKTEDKIHEIAFESGFNSVEYFCKKFKNITGKRPLEYRNL